jgi:hypothetical protein
MVTTSKTIGRCTNDCLIGTGKCLVSNVLIETNGTDDITLILYDNTTSGGKIVFKAIVPGEQGTKIFSFVNPISCSIGCYADKSGSGAAFLVYFV